MDLIDQPLPRERQAPTPSSVCVSHSHKNEHQASPRASGDSRPELGNEPASLRHLLHCLGRLGLRLAALAHVQICEQLLHLASHRRAAADVDMSRLRDHEAVELLGVLLDPLLYVDLWLARLSREGRAQCGDRARLLRRLKLLAIQVVDGRPAAAEVESHVAGATALLLHQLLRKGAERRDARAWAHHDHWRGRVGG